VTRFDRDTAVTGLAEGVFSARLDRGWWILHGPNGGYLAAILARACLGALRDPARALRTLSIHYLRPPEEGEVRIQVVHERSGGRLTTFSARMEQGGRDVALALAALSTGRGALELRHAAMPEAPPPEECEPREGRVPIHARYEARYPAAGAGRRAEVMAWIRCAEPRVVDAPLVAALTDALPPALYAWAGPDAGIGGLPTIDLTVHFRAPTPLPGARPEDWCLAVFRSRLVHDGFVEEDGEIWSRDGRLLAQSRQLAAVTGRAG
jgi:acyl-CoA thioesterase